MTASVPVPTRGPFMVLWCANATANLADGLAFVALPLLAASLTTDPRGIAGLATVAAVLRFIVVLPVGSLVDRVDRRILLVTANVVRGAIAIAFAIALSSSTGGLGLLYIMAGTIAVAEGIADTAATALVPSTVADHELEKANGRLSAAQLVADEFVGPPVGGFLCALAAALALSAMGGLWVGAGVIALMLPALRPPASAQRRRVRLTAEIAEGFRWVAGQRTVWALAVLGAMASVGYMLAFSVMVLVAQQRLGLTPMAYGVMMSLAALGGLAGAFLADPVCARLGARRTIVAALGVGSVALAVLGTTTSALVATMALAVYLLHAVVWGVCATSLRQRLTPDSMRGRATAVTRLGSLLGLVAGSVCGGVLAVIDLRVPLLVGSVVFAGCALLAALLLRRDGSAQAGDPSRNHG